MSERQTSTPFARSRASKKRSYIAKPMSPAEMRERSLAHNKAVAQEQAEMRGSKTQPSLYFVGVLAVLAQRQSLRLARFQERGQFKGGVAV